MDAAGTLRAAPTSLPADLEPILAAHRFEGTVVVQANVVMEETWWLLDLATRHESIRGVVAWVDLTDPMVGRTLDICLLHPKFKGVRHIVHDEPDVRWLLRGDVLYGLRELAAAIFPSICCCVRRICRRFPNWRLACQDYEW